MDKMGSTGRGEPEKKGDHRSGGRGRGGRKGKKRGGPLGGEGPGRHETRAKEGRGRGREKGNAHGGTGRGGGKLPTIGSVLKNTITAPEKGKPGGGKVKGTVRKKFSHNIKLGFFFKS